MATAQPNYETRSLPPAPETFLTSYDTLGYKKPHSRLPAAVIGCYSHPCARGFHRLSAAWSRAGAATEAAVGLRCAAYNVPVNTGQMEVTQKRAAFKLSTRMKLLKRVPLNDYDRSDTIASQSRRLGLGEPHRMRNLTDSHAELKKLLRSRQVCRHR